MKPADLVTSASRGIPHALSSTVPVCLRILAALVLLALLAQAGEIGSRDEPAACGICDGSSWIDCRRCDGRGKSRNPCEACAGKKSLSCFVCRGDGKFFCPNCGGENRIRWKGGATDPCKICSGGKVPCPFCRGKKELACPGCQRKGSFEGACEACFGLGGFPCPRCRPAGKCPECSGAGTVGCFACLGEGKFPTMCKECYGLGTKLCKHCIVGRARCGNCSGSGVVRYVQSGTGSKAGTQTCTTCKGKGWFRCGDCSGKGILECSPTGTATSCDACKGSPGKKPCTHCTKR